MWSLAKRLISSKNTDYFCKQSINKGLVCYLGFKPIKIGALFNGGFHSNSRLS